MIGYADLIDEVPGCSDLTFFRLLARGFRVSHSAEVDCSKQDQSEYSTLTPPRVGLDRESLPSRRVQGVQESPSTIVGRICARGRHDRWRPLCGHGSQVVTCRRNGPGVKAQGDGDYGGEEGDHIASRVGS